MLTLLYSEKGLYLLCHVPYLPALLGCEFIKEVGPGRKYCSHLMACPQLQSGCAALPRPHKNGAKLFWTETKRKLTEAFSL